MTIAPNSVDSHGRSATGIPAIDCPSWCQDPGHIAEISTDDQNCYSGSTDTDVRCSLSVEARPNFGACYSVVGAFAYRRFNCVPVVQLYVSGFEPNIDRTFDLTADEAEQLASHLSTAAALLRTNKQRGQED